MNKQKAAAMRQEARKTRLSVRNEKGYTILLQYNRIIGEWRLDISAPLVKPNDATIADCRQLFGVPRNCTWSWLYKNNRGRVRFTWLDNLRRAGIHNQNYQIKSKVKNG